MIGFMAILLFICVCIVLMAGFPVAFTLAGVSLLFAGIGILTNTFDPAFLNAFPNRVFGIMSNQILVAVPLFVFMGVMLEKSRVAERLLHNMGLLFGPMRGGLGVSVVLVGALLAASTGIIGASVVTMGLISLPTMLKQNYSPALSTGTIAATGTLGQIIPPSTVLIILGDVLSSAYQQSQLKMGIFSPDSISVADLFVGALIPGLLLVVLYLLYISFVALFRPAAAPAVSDRPALNIAFIFELLKGLLPPLVLIIAVLGSILTGIATPTEAAGIGAGCSIVLAVMYGQLSLGRLKEVMNSTLLVSGMVIIFFLGFILDFIEITLVVVPIVAPVLFMMGVDPIWLGIMIAINLQTSFLTPPFGFALFYLRGVTPKSIQTSTIYRGVAPFIGIQVLLLIALALWPEIATWLPEKLYP